MSPHGRVKSNMPMHAVHFGFHLGGIWEATSIRESRIGDLLYLLGLYEE